MTEFATIEAYIAFLESLETEILVARPVGLEAAAIALEHASKAALGHYQGPAGPFPGWTELHPVTQAERAEYGYPADEPLDVTGELRAHIEHNVDASAGTAAVGVPSVMVGEHDSDHGDPHTRLRDIGEVALGNELGLHGMPQRSFLGGPAAQHADQLINLMVAPVLAALGGAPILRIEAPPPDDDIPW
jgi:hypothetical protein